MQKIYDRENLFFAFPESWKLEGTEPLSASDSITVVGPEGEFWCIRRESTETATATVLSQAIDAMREEYKEIEIENVQETLEGTPLEGIDIHFFCLDLTGTASIRVWETSDCKWVIFTQAEDGRLERLKPTFKAITTSLLRGR